MPGACELKRCAKHLLVTACRRGASWASGDARGSPSGRSSADGITTRTLRQIPGSSPTDGKHGRHGSSGAVHITAVAGSLPLHGWGGFEVEAARRPPLSAQAPAQPQHVGWLSRLIPTRWMGLPLRCRCSGVTNLSPTVMSRTSVTLSLALNPNLMPAMASFLTAVGLAAHRWCCGMKGAERATRSPETVSPIVVQVAPTPGGWRSSKRTHGQVPRKRLRWME